MSDQHETIDDIIAEMRKAVVPMICGRPKIEAVSIRDVLQWSDRIKAAAERERETADLRAIHAVEMAERESCGEWWRICAACADGTPPERCAYYGDPNGCNAPTLGAHPEGDLAERLQDELEKAERRIAELERATGNAAEMREALIYVRDLMRRVRDGDRVSSLAFLGVVEHALAAPARNCDRFKTLDEAREAFQDLRGHKILADVELWDSMDEAGALVRWLFAPAAKEGGDHA